jgi:hypothetical protein
MIAMVKSRREYACVAKSVVVSAVELFGKEPDGVIREKRFSLSEGEEGSF